MFHQTSLGVSKYAIGGLNNDLTMSEMLWLTNY